MMKNEHNIYRSDMNMESVPRKFIRHKDGIEVFTNDGNVKAILRRTVNLLHEIEQVTFSARFYVREKDGWIETLTTHSYQSEREFMMEISKTEDFSMAAREMKEELK